MFYGHGHVFRGSTIINCRLQEGTEIETKLFLVLGVPESDRVVETVIFG
jgi:hypothetical protein